MSEIRTDTINNASGDNDSGIDLSTNDQVKIKTADTTAVTVDANQNVKVGGIETDQNSPLMVKTNSSTYALYLEENSGQESWQIGINSSGDLDFRNSGGTDPAVRFLDSNVFLFGKTADDNTSAGVALSTGGNGFVRSGAAPVGFNRTSNDGEVVRIQQDGTTEGSISVSGTTVTYGGGHLARWSRLLNNSKDTTIVKGTVMTNLDEMVEWSYEEVLWTDEDELPDGVSVGDVKTSAYTEDNEQLNKMAVSSVEGDANVAGVFVSWDDDDDFNDMNIAMTGDMVIRIAQGTTVARGDLLMSAGDGTAKPQGDDIVRSKTIAKVTSTNVSHTYDDGSYLVPCVLMAC